MMVDEAIAVAAKFLDSSSIHMVNRGVKFDQNSVVFDAGHVITHLTVHTWACSIRALTFNQAVL